MGRAGSLLGIALVVVLPGLAAAQAAPALSEVDPGSEARARVQLGTVLYEQGRFEEAGQNFERAHEVSGHPAMLYNAFVAYRRADRPRLALAALDRFLESDAASADERVDLEAQRDALRELVAALPPSEGEAEPAAREPDPSPARAHEEPDAVPVATEDAGGPDLFPPAIVLSIGAIGLLTAAGLGAAVVAEDDALRDRCAGGCPPDLASAVERGRALAAATDAAWIGGAALAVAGVIWLAVVLVDGPDRHAGRPLEARF